MVFLSCCSLRTHSTTFFASLIVAVLLWLLSPLTPAVLSLRDVGCPRLVRQIKKRNRDGTGRGRGKNQNNNQNAGQNTHPSAIDDTGAQSSSDDDDSYGSQQDRRSDGGYRGGRQ